MILRASLVRKPASTRRTLIQKANSLASSIIKCEVAASDLHTAVEDVESNSASFSSSLWGLEQLKTSAADNVDMNVANQTKRSLKPLGKRMKKKLKIAKKKYQGKGKIRRKCI